MQCLKSSLSVFILSIFVTAAAVAQDDTDEEGRDERDMDAKQCVRISSVEEIEIVDAQTLIFHMRGDEVYRNDLPHKCPGLKYDDTLMYRSSVGQLCNVDIITVLDDWGFGFSPGVSCGLGMFHPITEQIAEELLQSNR